jgi:hypothetical protein
MREELAQRIYQRLEAQMNDERLARTPASDWASD